MTWMVNHFLQEFKRKNEDMSENKRAPSGVQEEE